ncbi:MAG: tetratricopeptide repeat protein [Deltaproteobacteria bacterium]|nr:tetratricopeptide repeat protein [Deltaproteobacteria bacterium]
MGRMTGLSAPFRCGTSTLEALLVFAALGLACPAALAQAPKPPVANVDEAKREFEVGLTFFDAEEFQSAHPHLLRAYELSKGRPSVTFTLAQCERALGMFDEALAHYREYLAAKPKNAGDVEKTIEMVKVMKAQKEEEARKVEAARAEAAKAEAAKVEAKEPPSKAAEQPPSTLTQAPPPQSEDDGLFASPWFWVAAGVGVAAIGAGVVIATSGDPYSGNLGLSFSGE